MQPTDGHNTRGQLNPSVLGKSGPLLITVPNSPGALDAMVIETTKQLSDEFPFNLDMNSGNELGVGESFIL